MPCLIYEIKIRTLSETKRDIDSGGIVGHGIGEGKKHLLEREHGDVTPDSMRIINWALDPQATGDSYCYAKSSVRSGYFAQNYPRPKISVKYCFQFTKFAFESFSASSYGARWRLRLSKRERY